VFGSNSVNQLGIPFTLFSNIPIPIILPQKISKLVSGGYFNFIQTESREIYAFGENSDGQLGLGHNQPVFAPTLLTFFQGQLLIKEISCGRNSTMALVDSGQLYVWGLNNYGQLGIACDGIVLIPEPLTFFDGMKIKSFSMGVDFILV